MKPETQTKNRNMKHLFIGGVADGRWIEITDATLPFINVEEEKEMELGDPEKAHDVNEIVKYDTYARTSLDTMNRGFVVYAEHTMGTKEVLSKLITNYNPEPE